MYIPELIIDWYAAEKRDLPWRNTKDPYKIWLSEIILQQTRVSQGMEYYHRFVENFPTIVDLANAEEDQILKLWQGLGYYSRARNLHATAKQIVNEHNSKFPANFEAIKNLKGIGDYTAAAISSFAFNLPHAAVDGNVYRVLSRIFGIVTPIDSTSGKKEFAKIADELLIKKNAATYNQAMMEFGALQCVPKNPNCTQCVVSQQCIAFKNKTVDELPIKTKKLKQRVRYFYYFVVEDEQQNIFIAQRTGKDIWQHLYEFPLVETEKELKTEDIFSHENFLKIVSNDAKNAVVTSVSRQYKHILSHQIIYAQFIHLKTSKRIVSGKYQIIKKENIHTYAVSRLTHMYLEENF